MAMAFLPVGFLPVGFRPRLPESLPKSGGEGMNECVRCGTVRYGASSDAERRCSSGCTYRLVMLFPYVPTADPR